MKQRIIVGQNVDSDYKSETITVEEFSNGELNLFIEQESIHGFAEDRWATVALSREARMELINALLDSLCTPDEK